LVTGPRRPAAEGRSYGDAIGRLFPGRIRGAGRSLRLGGW